MNLPLRGVVPCDPHEWERPLGRVRGPHTHFFKLTLLFPPRILAQTRHVVESRRTLLATILVYRH